MPYPPDKLNRWFRLLDLCMQQSNKCWNLLLLEQTKKKKEEGLFQMKTDMTFLIRSHFPKCVYIYGPASFSLPIPIDGFRVPEPMHPSMGQY